MKNSPQNRASAYAPFFRHNVTLQHLRCFLAVADTCSFTLAASRLFISPSALTATVQQFEAAVGLKMFDRTTRRVVMTEHARRFKPEAEMLVENFSSAIGNLMAVAKSERGHIRIAAAATAIHQFLANVIPRFRAAHPNITIALHDPAAQQAERLILDGEVDFAIDCKVLGYDDLDYTPLVADRYGIVCHRDSPLARHPAPLRWCDLTSDGYVAFGANTGIGHFLRGHAEHWPVLGGVHDEVASTTALLAVLGMGDRYSVVPALALKGRELPGLVFQELGDPPLAREICLITSRLRSLPPSAQQLLDMVLADIRRQTLPSGVSLLATDRNERY